MLRLRFSSGLILGLVVGVPVGVLIGVFMLPARGTDPGAATNLQVIELTRKLEAAEGRQGTRRPPTRTVPEARRPDDRDLQEPGATFQRPRGIAAAARRATPGSQPEAKARARTKNADTEVKAPAQEPTGHPTDASTGSVRDAPAEPVGGEPDDSANTG